MNIPLGESFILTLSSAATAGLPIYMGATDIQDPNQDFVGSPGSVIDFDSNLEIGLRYNIGSNKRSKETK
jgi:hypothetical protein